MGYYYNRDHVHRHGVIVDGFDLSNYEPCPMTDDIEEEMEDCDYIVCAVAAGLEPISDDILDECSKCQIPILYRPHMPEKPKKICMRCAVDMMTLDAQ